MVLKKLRNCFIRFLLLIETIEDCDKGEMNDLENNFDDMKKELLDLLKLVY